jgi:GT2 family glycosyltransferase
MAAVVLHYGTPDETAIAVRALRACDAPVDRVIVVDNDDHPGELDLGAVGVPVERMVTGRNLGFPGGMNVGIRRALAAGADAVLLVNSDVVVPPDAPQALARALADHPEAGIVGPVMLARERPASIASLGIRFHEATGRMRNIEGHEAVEALPRWQRVDAVNGAAFLVSRRVFERVGLFDDAYFLSFEEIEFCMRARAAGFASGVTGDAVVYHRGGASLPSASPARFYYAARNHLRVAEHARPSSPLARAARAGLIVALNLAHALTAPGGERLERVRATMRGVRDYVRGRFGPESETESAGRGRML